MVTIITSGHGSYKVSGSEFFGFLFKAPTRNAFESELETIKKEHHTATHHCWARRIGLPDVEEFSQDDGEPAGTAGLPILNRLRSEELINAGLVVVRYYGGTPLGKPGLINAYGVAAQAAIKQAVLAGITPTRVFRIEYRYEYQTLIEKWKHAFSLIEKEAEYQETVSMSVACPENSADQFRAELKRNEYLLLSFKETGASMELKTGG